MSGAERTGDGSAEAERSAPEPRRTRALVIAENFDRDAAFAGDVEREQHLESLFERAMPELAPATNAIIVGYSSRTSERLREELRETLGSLSEQFAALCSMRAGIDLTVNAIEVPESGWDDLIVDRLVEFFRGKHGVLSSGSALPIEMLEDQSLKSALVNEFI